MRIGVIAALVVCACGRVSFDPLSEGGMGGDGGASSDAPLGACTPATIASCPEQVMTVSLGVVASANATVTTSHGLASGMCGSGNANPEVTFRVTPTNRAKYQIQAVALSPFTPIYILDGCCGGVELACGVITSPLLLDRGGGETFTVVVEGGIGAGIDLMIGGVPDVD